jgi:hypothetical protein
MLWFFYFLGKEREFALPLGSSDAVSSYDDDVDCKLVTEGIVSVSVLFSSSRFLGNAK